MRLTRGVQPPESPMRLSRAIACHLAGPLWENVGDENNWFFGPLKRRAEELAGGSSLLWHGSRKSPEAARWRNDLFNSVQLGLHLSTRMDTAIDFVGNGAGFLYAFTAELKPLTLKRDLGLWDAKHWWKDPEARTRLQQVGFDPAKGELTPSVFTDNGYNAIRYPNMKEPPYGAMAYIILDVSILEQVMVLDMSKPNEQTVVYP